MTDSHDPPHEPQGNVVIHIVHKVTGAHLATYHCPAEPNILGFPMITQTHAPHDVIDSFDLQALAAEAVRDDWAVAEELIDDQLAFALYLPPHE